MKKLISILLSCALISSFSTTYPINAISGTDENDQSEFNILSSELPESLVELIEEESGSKLQNVRDDDDLYSITYENEDGSKSSKLFNTQIKYENEDGEVEFIDTSIEEYKDSTGEYQYKNAANDFLAEFSTDAQTGVRLTDEGYSVGFSVPQKKADDQKKNIKTKSKKHKKHIDSRRYKISDTDENANSSIITAPEVSEAGDTEEIIINNTQETSVFTEVESSIEKNQETAEQTGTYSDTELSDKSIAETSIESEIVEDTDDIVTADYENTVVVTADDGSVSGDDSQEFVYPDAFGEQTKLLYTNTLRGIKEDIILDANPGINTFTLDLTTNGLVPVLIEDGKALILTEPREDNNYENVDPSDVKYYIPSIYVYDSYVMPDDENLIDTAYQHYTEECNYELEKVNDGQYKLTLVVSESFLNDSRTVYPVTIDPTLNVSNTSSNIDDTYITSATPSTNYYLADCLRVGNNNVSSSGNGAGNYYTYIKYKSLPALPGGSVIQSAYLRLNFTPGQTTAKNAKIFHLDSSWTGSQLTWNSSKPVVGSVVDSNVSSNGCSYYNFNVIQSINSWYNHVNANNGWRIDYSNASDRDLNRLYSSDCGISSQIPHLTINYKSAEEQISPRIISNGYYFIRNVNSGKYIDVYNGNTGNGTSVIQCVYNGNQNQQWKVTYESDGYYSLKPMHVNNGNGSSLDLQSSSGANTNGTDAKIYSYSSGYQEQKFTIKAAPGNGGGYEIGTKTSNGNKVLEVTDSSLNDNAIIQIWESSSDRTNDNWVFEKAFGCAWTYNSRANANKTTQYYINCYLYALGIGTRPVPQYDGLSMNYGDSVDTVANRVIANVLSRGRYIRKISGPTAKINSNEYRFCLRVGSHVVNGEQIKDYHFWLQTYTGEWCDKAGWFNAPQLRGYVNPADVDWKLGTISRFYDSSIIYFAATL
ncbi:MAG: DNRLRE domain-containing protein [Oscillospiraceae bacterium]|nr:DNRLRE domain-containing protein [Oscillospiraceae bacterium]